MYGMLDEYTLSNIGEIYLFGAGKYGLVTMIKMISLPVYVKGIIVTDRSANPVSIWGTPVMEITDIKEDYKSVNVIISTLQNKQKEIDYFLQENGFENVFGIEDDTLYRWEAEKSILIQENANVIH